MKRLTKNIFPIIGIICLSILYGFIQSRVGNITHIYVPFLVLYILVIGFIITCLSVLVSKILK